MDRLKLALAAPLAPIMLPAEAPQEDTGPPRVEEVQRWLEELRYYVAVGIFDPSSLLRMQVQHLEYSLMIVMDEVLLQDAEETAMNAAEFVLRE
jgi:hypothetical protein